MNAMHYKNSQLFVASLMRIQYHLSYVLSHEYSSLRDTGG